MGKQEHLGRYPFHLHNVGAGGVNSYATRVSVHHSYQRCMVVHCTDGATISDSTCYDIVGFAWMLVRALALACMVTTAGGMHVPFDILDVQCCACQSQLHDMSVPSWPVRKA